MNTANELAVLAYRQFYNTLIPIKGLRWEVMSKLKYFIKQLESYIIKMKNNEYFYSGDYDKFILEIENYLKINFKIEVYNTYETIRKTKNPSFENADLGAVFKNILIELINERNNRYSGYKIKIDISCCNHLQLIYNCLTDYGLHKEIYNRDRELNSRFNIIIEHRHNRKTICKEPPVILLSFNHLNEKYLIPRKEGRSIVINGRTIPASSIEKITITSTLLRDDEIPNFKEKIGSNSDLNFTLACYNETNRLVEFTRLDSNIELNSDLWNLIHPSISKAAKASFYNGNFTEAVRSAFIELNDIIKLKYQSISGIESDGVRLMRKVFSIENPIFHFDDMKSESGRNIQEGYGLMFEGSMKGIRNPKAHKNIKIEAVDALEKIFIASHLLKIFEKSKYKSDI